MIAVYLIGFSYPTTQSPLHAVAADLERVLRFSRDIYQCTPTIINDANYNGFDNLLINDETQLDKIFFYFSGHGIEGKIVLPDIAVEHAVFLNTILSRIVRNNKAQILWVVDCCQAGKFSLPFVLADGIFVDVTDYTHCKWDVLCLSASSDDIAVSTTSSLFTEHLISNLELGKVIGLSNLVNNILIEISPRCPRQMVTVSSSRPRLEFLWPWAVGLRCTVRVFSNKIEISK